MHDFERKGGVLETGFAVPRDFEQALNADVPPDQRRQVLWNMAEAAENRKNSTTAREWEIALPAELPPEAQKSLVSDFSAILAGNCTALVWIGLSTPQIGRAQPIFTRTS